MGLTALPRIFCPLAGKPHRVFAAAASAVPASALSSGALIKSLDGPSGSGFTLGIAEDQTGKDKPLRPAIFTASGARGESCSEGRGVRKSAEALFCAGTTKAEPRRRRSTKTAPARAATHATATDNDTPAISKADSELPLLPPSPVAGALVNSAEWIATEPGTMRTADKVAEMFHCGGAARTKGAKAA